MKKLINKFLATTLIFTMISATFLPISAERVHDHHDDCVCEEAITRGISQPCPCGGSFNLSSREYLYSVGPEEVKCTHKKYGTDLVTKKYYSAVYRCNLCGDGYNITEVDTVVNCHGYDY